MMNRRGERPALNLSSNFENIEFDCVLKGEYDARFSISCNEASESNFESAASWSRTGKYLSQFVLTKRDLKGAPCYITCYSN